MLEICNEKEKASLYFSVQDDGIGIEEEKQKLIFQNFEQADESEIARRQETGLGLAISRRLIHMMDSVPRPRPSCLEETKYRESGWTADGF